MNNELPKLPDYNNCLVNLANSILNEFGVSTTAKTLPLADEYLKKDRKNVVILILDAMGTSIIEKHLLKDGFFRSHYVGSFDSVYPPTTVAATTSIISGQYPNEHGWLGWDMYYPKLDKNVTVYTNTDQLSESNGVLDKPKKAAQFNAGFTYTPYISIVDKIKEAGKKAYFSMPFNEPYPQNIDEILDRIQSLCKEEGKKYIYAYWNEPDSTMHRTGTLSKETHDVITDLEEKIKEFAKGLSDTILFISADHGHIDCSNYCILDYPDIMTCLRRMPSIEPRTLNLFIKDEYMDTFPDIFNRHFGDSFVLLTREEVLDKKLFGIGKDHADLKDMIGDYVAVSVSDVSVFNTHHEADSTPGGHAGLTEEEYVIPLIVVER
ncbi:MAG: alkaline phosphatase family protein [Lachnospiraceae bacterium]|nr:alkaline phosphatase family protein [Lachnospiraceae bacterium]